MLCFEHELYENPNNITLATGNGIKFTMAKSIDVGSVPTFDLTEPNLGVR